MKTPTYEEFCTMVETYIACGLVTMDVHPEKDEDPLFFLVDREAFYVSMNGGAPGSWLSRYAQNELPFYMRSTDFAAIPLARAILATRDRTP